MPRFSIGLPCKTVVSGVAQTLSTIIVAAVQEDTEIIIGVQDFTASDSSLINFLSEQPRVSVIDTSLANNLSGTLNLIIRASQSRYFVRTDDDDFMHPLRLKRLRKIFDEENNLAIVGQAYKPFNGQRAANLVIPSAYSLTNKLKLLIGVPFAHPSITLDLMLTGTNPYDESQTYAQDYMLYVDMITKGKYVGNAGLATYYRVPEIITDLQKHKRRKQLLNHERAMKKLWNLVSERIYSDYEIHLLRGCFVTKEFANPECDKYRQWCTNCLANAMQKLSIFVGS